MLIGNSLHKQYDGKIVVNDVTASVSPGSVTIVLGPSGSGKSTLVRLLSATESLDDGNLTLDGITIISSNDNFDNKKPSLLWPRVTVVFQQLFLWPHMTLLKNITLPARLQQLKPERFQELALKLGISDVMERYPNQVSIGQKQRAALMRALLLNPKYLILDEITAALDVEQIASVGGILKDAISSGMGLLVVTHHIGFARLLLQSSQTGTFLFIEGGSVIEKGEIGEFECPTTTRFESFMKTAQAVM